MSFEGENAIDMLTRDHRELEGLLYQLDNESNPVNLCILLARVGHKLAAHEAAEQLVVFPAFRSAIPGHEQEAIRRVGDFGEVNQMLAEMRALMPGDPGFAKRASAVYHDLRAHFSAEEEEVFPRLTQSMSRLELADLRRRVLAVKRAGPRFPEAERGGAYTNSGSSEYRTRRLLPADRDAPFEPRPTTRGVADVHGAVEVLSPGAQVGQAAFTVQAADPDAIIGDD
jgi:hemerythrin superfamily protein